MELAIRYPAVPRTRTPPMMNFVRARTTATSWRLAPDWRLRRLVERRASYARHDRVQFLLCLSALFRRPEVQMLIRITYAKQKLVDELAERGVSAAFGIGPGGGLAHVGAGKSVARPRRLTSADRRRCGHCHWWEYRTGRERR